MIGPSGIKAEKGVVIIGSYRSNTVHGLWFGGAGGESGRVFCTVSHGEIELELSSGCQLCESHWRVVDNGLGEPFNLTQFPAIESQVLRQKIGYTPQNVSFFETRP